MGPPQSEEYLQAEQRGAHARVLKSCGKKTACIRKPRAPASRVSGASGAALPAAVPVTRWAESEYDELRVWIAPGDSLPLWRVENLFIVRDAFHAWTGAGAPVRFAFVSDSMRADVHVLWRDSLPESRAGQVTRYVDRRGWVRGAIIEMNTRNMGGGGQDPATVGSVALHEIGHLLGLEHSDDERDIMAAWVTAPRLTSRDQSAMRGVFGAVDARMAP